MCIEYAKRINELQTIARKSSLADLLRYIYTYSKETAASLGLGRETKAVTENNKNRDKLVLQIMILGFVLRILAPQIFPEAYMAWIHASATCWFAGFSLLAWRYIPYLLAPRIDGKEH